MKIGNFIDPWGGWFYIKFEESDGQLNETSDYIRRLEIMNKASTKCLINDSTHIVARVSDSLHAY